jgi:translation initiation factor 2 beta subunit (eIF-2beta)/eIF-5
MKCKKCGGRIKLVIGCRNISLNCLDCGKTFPVQAYLDQIDEKSLERISMRPCDRV